MLQFVPLETLIRRAPLGLRFLDLVRGLAVSDSLDVLAWQVGATHGAIPAVSSPVSGAYGWRDLPGLLSYELGLPGAPTPPPPPPEPAADDLVDLNTLRSLVEADAGAPPPNFVIYVADRQGRFLPQVLPMNLPKGGMLEVPLFSAPARPAPAGFGVVRGQLQQRAGGAPAAWALVVASPDGVQTFAGIADGRGMFTLFMPYAGTLPPLVGSPPHGATGMGQLSWPVTLRVFYQPSQLRTVTWPVEVAPPGGIRPPETRSILEQAAAQVYGDPGVAAASIVQPLRLGQDLVVRTSGGSTLLVDAA